MAQTYEEYLKSMGATPEELKVLVTPVSTKAFEKVQADMAEAERQKAIAQTDFQNIRDWYDTKALPSYEKMQRETVEARGERAKALELLKAAQDAGLAELADKMDDKKNAPNPNPTHPDFDPNKYVSKDEISGFVNSAGSGLAQMQDDVLEHMQLFPTQRLNVTALREKAVKAGKDFHTMWMQEYNVEAARKAADDAAKEAERKKWMAEGAAAKETELVSKFANPETRPMTPSNSPFAARPATGRDKMPWESGDKSAERVERATRKVIAEVVH
jgi:hypothetical protein